MSRDRALALRAMLSSPELFSRHVAGRPLRNYQLEPARAILASVLAHKGLTFTVMMSRQAGKNELSAQLEAMLLTLYSRRGGSIVKCAPTFRPQLINSMQRVQTILDCGLLRSRWATSLGYIVAVGKARAFYLSAAPDSSIVGATASLLLEVDEAQDVGEDKYLKDFRPMGASTNVTTVLYGTSWTDDTLLEHTVQTNALQEAADGIKRNFRYPWHLVGAENADYRRFVESEISRMGPEHPLVRTQYLLQALSSGGRMFSAEQLMQLAGDHAAQEAPDPGTLYVAGIDLAGGDEEDLENILRPAGRRRDSTTLTIGRVTWAQVLGHDEPTIEIVRLQSWLNVKHRDLFQELVSTLRLWRCSSIVVDASGIGAGVASFLVGALGADIVHPLTFTAVSKSDLGYQLITAVNSGRLRVCYYRPPTQVSEALWVQLRLAKSTLHANQRLSFQVDPREGHDDLLISLALVVEAAQHSRPRAAVGRVAR